MKEKMTIEKLLDKYNMDLEVEVSEKTEEEKAELIKDMESLGWHFHASEHRYLSCVMWIFDRG